MIPDGIPLFEFDSDPRAVLEPTHEGLNLQLPKKCVFAFLGDAIDAYAARVQARTASHFISATKRYPVYVVRHRGEDIALCRAPFPEGVFLISRRALRAEGASTTTRRPRATSTSANTHGARSGRRCAHTALPYQEVLTWSTDGFYRETRVKVEARRREGCALVEMECAALATCAGFRGAIWGMILYTADSLANRVTAVQRTATI